MCAAKTNSPPARRLPRLADVRQSSTSLGVVIPASPSVMSPFVATDLAFRDAVLRVPAQRLGTEWSYAGRTLRPGAVTTFYGPSYELRATVLSVARHDTSMKQADDHLALGVIEQSAIVTAVERAATRLSGSGEVVERAASGPFDGSRGWAPPRGDAARRRGDARRPGERGGATAILVLADYSGTVRRCRRGAGGAASAGWRPR